MGSGKSNLANMIALYCLGNNENFIIAGDRFCEWRHFLNYSRYVKELILIIPLSDEYPIHYHNFDVKLMNKYIYVSIICAGICGLFVAIGESAQYTVDFSLGNVTVMDKDNFVPLKIEDIITEKSIISGDTGSMVVLSDKDKSLRSKTGRSSIFLSEKNHIFLAICS